MPTLDLSKDSEAQVANGDKLTERQLAEERVITKVFSMYAIPLEITDSIRSTFKSKLWRIGKAHLKKWEETVWPLTINAHEVNRQLISRKRQLKNS